MLSLSEPESFLALFVLATSEKFAIKTFFWRDLADLVAIELSGLGLLAKISVDRSRLGILFCVSVD